MVFMVVYGVSCGRMPSSPYGIRVGRPRRVAPTVIHHVQRGRITSTFHADGLRPFGPLPHRRHLASPPTYTARLVGCVAQPT